VVKGCALDGEVSITDGNGPSKSKSLPHANKCFFVRLLSVGTERVLTAKLLLLVNSECSIVRFPE
jgi:hypothetical protein